MALETAEEFIEQKQQRWTAERARGKPTIRIKTIDRLGYLEWFGEKRTFLVQHNLPTKVLVVERLRFEVATAHGPYPGGAAAGDVDYRFGYYTVGAIGNRKGGWTWGQFAPLIPHNDLTRLLDQARSDGTILASLPASR